MADAAAVPELKTATQIASELQGSGKPTEDPSDPRDAKEYSFDFSHTDPRGQLWAGKFTNRILTIKQRRLMKVTKAQLAGGVPMASLDADIWEINEMIAHLVVSLDQTADGFPDWARNLEDLYDEQIVYKLYAEVDSHEARFRRREPATETSSGADKDGAR